MSGIPSAVDAFISAFNRLGMKDPTEVRLADYDQLLRLQYELREYILEAPGRRYEAILHGVKFTAPCPTCGCTHSRHDT